MAAGDDRSNDVGDDASSLMSDADVDIDAHWPGSERHLIGLEVKALVVARLIVRGTTMTKKTRAARVLGMCIRGALDRNVRLMSHVEWNDESSNFCRPRAADDQEVATARLERKPSARRVARFITCVCGRHGIRRSM